MRGREERSFPFATWPTVSVTRSAADPTASAAASEARSAALEAVPVATSLSWPADTKQQCDLFHGKDHLSLGYKAS